jgi:hypothetical protein
VLLSVDFALLAIVVWQLTRSRWGAVTALLLLGINPAFSYAYFDTGVLSTSWRMRSSGAFAL